MEAYGDRIAFRAFFQTKAGTAASFVGRIKEKISKKQSTKYKHLSGNTHAQKTSRRVEIGWLNKTKGIYKQVKAKSGGGTRSIVKNVDITVKELQTIGMDMFFPNGQSARMGHIEEYNVTILKYDHSTVASSVTLGEMYNSSGLRMIRLYICTERKREILPESNLCANLTTSSHEMSSTPNPNPQCSDILGEMHEIMPERNTSTNSSANFIGDEMLSTPNPNPQCSDIVGEIHEIMSEINTSKNSCANFIGDEMLSTPNPNPQCSDILGEMPKIIMPEINTVTNSCANFIGDEISSTPYPNPQCSDILGEMHGIMPESNTSMNSCDNVTRNEMSSTPNANAQCSDILRVAMREVMPDCNMLTNSHAHTDTHIGEIVSKDKRSDMYSNLSESSSSSPISGIAATSGQPSGSFYDNVMLGGYDDGIVSFGPPPHESIQTLNIRVHRGHVLRELIETMKEVDSKKLHCATIRVVMIMPNGREEAGEDTGGVCRDMLSEFWNDFYNNMTVGNTLKVPSLIPAMGQSDWESVGKVIQLGYQQQHVLPVQLAPSFLHFALTAEEPDKKTLLGDYLEFLPTSESTLVSKALASYDDVDTDELLDFFDDHHHSVRPRKESFKENVLELAHNEIIQQPTYVAKQLRPYLQSLEQMLPDGAFNLDALKPTFQRVWGSLNFDSDVRESDKRLMKRFLRDSESLLPQFLRFCTGIASSSSYSLFRSLSLFSLSLSLLLSFSLSRMRYLSPSLPCMFALSISLRIMQS